ncbi:MAG: DUF998 domain-containing protein [Chloroflexi bacterium]|nr:DUF998 domain-containing protein [Chloroflexota bacterium]
MSTTQRLLTCGVVAGPLYLAMGLGQALTRPGFDLRRHDLSLLANGSLGWIQIGTFLISGALVVAAAVGLGRALGAARTWGPLLIGLYGLGVALGGVFLADPALGFPTGTAAGASAISWHGMLHLLCGAIGFMALIAACFVFGNRFAHEGRGRWAAFSAATGAVFLVGFIGGIAGSGAGSGWGVLGLWIAVVSGWAWLSALSVQAVRA